MTNSPRSPAVSVFPVAESSSSGAATPVNSPFADVHATGTPYSASAHASTSGFATPAAPPQQRFFHSRRIKKEDISQPWLAKSDPYEKWVTIGPCFGLLFGLAICGVLVWQGMSTVVNPKQCPVLMEDWSGGFNEKVWTREVEVGGFGNGQFEYTTNEEENSFVKDGALHIRPTLQDEKLLTKNNVLNLTKLGICSSTLPRNCVAVTNTTNGTIIPPVKSARISTRYSHSIKYGRIEVTAKLPAGKWLWPAIWMLPLNSTYGPWPASGEMDLVESRGNAPGHPQGGNNIISSTLHWGPDALNDAWWRTNVKHEALHTTFAKKFHTFGIEWNEKYIFTYVNSRLLTVLFTNFQQRLWERGNFPLANENGTRYVDPWGKGGDNAPFDQPFYLLMNLAVGGTNGWFENGKDEKPWVDGSRTEKKDFWEKRDEWWPEWQETGEMVIKSVKMWQQC